MKTFHFTLAVLLLAGLAAIPVLTHVYAVPFVFPKHYNVSHSDPASYFPQIAASSDSIGIVWQEDNVVDSIPYTVINYARSTDNGNTFAEPVIIGQTTGFSNYPTILIHEQNVHIIWRHVDNGQAGFYYVRSTDNGETFSDPLNLSALFVEPGDTDYTYLAALDGMNLYLIATEGNSAPKTVLVKSTDGGETFEASQISPLGPFALDMAAASGKLYIAAQDPYSSNREIFFAKLDSNGTLLQGPDNVSNSTGESYAPSIAVNGDNVYVSYSDSDGLFFVKSTDDGASFSPPLNLDTLVTFGTTDPDVAVSGDNVFIVSHSFVLTFIASHDGGETFSPHTKIDSGGYGKVAAVNDNVYLTWWGAGPPELIWPDAHFTQSGDAGITFGTEANNVPVAKANDALIDEGVYTALDVSGTYDPDGDALLYFWSQLSGPPVLFNNSGICCPFFQAPEVTENTTMTFELTVTDGIANSTDLLTLLVREIPFNTTPVAADDSVEITSEESVLVDVFANDFDPDGHSYDITSITYPAFGTAVYNGNGTFTYTPPPAGSTSFDTFGYCIIDTLGAYDCAFVWVTFGSPGEYDLKILEGSSDSDGLVNMNQTVTALAETDNSEVDIVIFRWISPYGDIMQESVVNASSLVAEDSFAPNDQGEWIVVADFGNGQIVQKSLNVSFFVLPESPVGSIALVTASIGALAAFAYLRIGRKVASY